MSIVYGIGEIYEGDCMSRDFFVVWFVVCCFIYDLVFFLIMGWRGCWRSGWFVRIEVVSGCFDFGFFRYFNDKDLIMEFGVVYFFGGFFCLFFGFKVDEGEFVVFVCYVLWDIDVCDFVVFGEDVMEVWFGGSVVKVVNMNFMVFGDGIFVVFFFFWVWVFGEKFVFVFEESVFFSDGFGWCFFVVEGDVVKVVVGIDFEIWLVNV